MKTCGNCGIDNDDDARYCYRCGIRMSELVQADVSHDSTHNAYAEMTVNQDKKSRNLTIAGIVLFAVVFLGAAIWLGNNSRKTNSLSNAMNSCQQQVDADEWELYTGGDDATYRMPDSKTLVMDGASTDDPILQCLIDEIDMPNSVRSKINQTRALDGIMTDSWDGISASWSYQSDKGLDMFLEEK